MIKFLLGETERVSVTKKLKSGVDVRIAFTAAVITSAIQMRLADMARFLVSDEGKQRYISLQFKNCIDGGKVTINDQDFEAVKLADNADFTDATTSEIIGIISHEIDKRCTTNEKEIKK